MVTTSRTIVVGWEEWLALPDLGLPAIKAKIDTGARTSALHAYFIETFGPAAAPMVRFGIHPVPGRSDISVTCAAPVIDRREVTSSNGESEQRFVIASRVVMGPHEWPIEITLANREGMSYRMLLGRQAIRDDMVVDPAASFLQPRLSFRLYGRPTAGSGARDSLRIALLTRRSASPSSGRIMAVAEARGHTVELLDPAELILTLGERYPVRNRQGEAIGPFDAIVPRLGTGVFAAALVRQLELGGGYAMNSGDALDRLRNPLGVRQSLAHRGLPLAALDVDEASAKAEVKAALRQVDESHVRCAVCVIGGKAYGGFELLADHPRPIDETLKPSLHALAASAAAQLSLGLVRIDIAVGPVGPYIAGVSSAPDLGLFERFGAGLLAPAIVDDIEAHTHMRV